MKKILIVDDEANVLAMLCRALIGWEAEVITATTIEAAEYAINHSHCDIVLSDIRLTGMLDRTGLELIPYVKEKSPGTQTIIMTGYGTPEIEKEAYERGAFYYFEKPIDLKILLARLGDLGLERKSIAEEG